jgi:hypothetical protein
VDRIRFVEGSGDELLVIPYRVGEQVVVVKEQALAGGMFGTEIAPGREAQVGGPVQDADPQAGTYVGKAIMDVEGFREQLGRVVDDDQLEGQTGFGQLQNGGLGRQEGAQLHEDH